MDIILVAIVVFVLQLEIYTLRKQIKQVDIRSSKRSDLVKLAEMIKMLSLEIREIEDKK